jgi:hypothetical protein
VVLTARGRRSIVGEQSYTGSELRGAQFVDADLRGARFVRADLSGVVMRRNPWAPERLESTLKCLHVILEEEWEHHRYAVRDLDAIEAGSRADDVLRSRE